MSSLDDSKLSLYDGDFEEKKQEKCSPDCDMGLFTRLHEWRVPKEEAQCPSLFNICSDQIITSLVKYENSDRAKYEVLCGSLVHLPVQVHQQLFARALKRADLSSSVLHDLLPEFLEEISVWDDLWFLSYYRKSDEGEKAGGFNSWVLSEVLKRNGEKDLKRISIQNSLRYADVSLSLSLLDTIQHLSLTHLHLQYVPLPLKSVHMLLSSSSLISLNIAYCGTRFGAVTSSHFQSRLLKALQSSPQLLELDVSGHTFEILEVFIIETLRLLPSLKILRTIRCSCLEEGDENDPELDWDLPPTSLEEFCFSGVSLWESFLSNVISHSPLLHTIEMQNVSSITDEFVELVAKSCPLIHSLNLSDHYYDRNVLKAFEGFPLRRLHAGWCPDLMGEGWRNLLSSCDTLEYLCCQSVTMALEDIVPISRHKKLRYVVAFPSSSIIFLYVLFVFTPSYCSLSSFSFCLLLFAFTRHRFFFSLSFSQHFLFSLSLSVSLHFLVFLTSLETMM